MQMRCDVVGHMTALDQSKSPKYANEKLFLLHFPLSFGTFSFLWQVQNVVYSYVYINFVP